MAVSHFIGNLSETTKNASDHASLVLFVASLGWGTILTVLASVLSITWYSLRIYEWFEKRKERRQIERAALDKLQPGLGAAIDLAIDQGKDPHA